MSRSAPNARVYHVLIGDGPWDCPVCGSPIVRIGQRTRDGNVHHLDGNAWNNKLSNLVVVHTDCHQRYYHPVTEAMKKQISEKLKGRPSPTKGMKFSPETNAKKSRPGVANPMHGRTHTPEALAKMRQPRPKQKCSDCGRIYTIGWITRHKKEGKCKP